MYDKQLDNGGENRERKPHLSTAAKYAIVIGFLGIVFGVSSVIGTEIGHDINYQVRNNLAENMISTVTAYGPENYQYELDQIPRAIREATVEIFMINPDGLDAGGSGTVLEYLKDKNGKNYAVVLTAGHVFNNKDDMPLTYIQARTPEFGNYVDERKCKYMSDDVGICILSLGSDTAMMQNVKPIGIDMLKIYDPGVDGSTLMSYGFPAKPDLNTGVVSTMPFVTDLPNINITSDGRLFSPTGLAVPGASGGPIYTLDGKIVGVMSEYGMELSDLIDQQVDGAMIAPLRSNFFVELQNFINETIPN